MKLAPQNGAVQNPGGFATKKHFSQRGKSAKPLVKQPNADHDSDILVQGRTVPFRPSISFYLIELFN